MATADSACGICRIHGDRELEAELGLGGNDLWLLRHHPPPAPLAGWLLLDARRHLAGPLVFNDQEAASWGLAVRAASQLVQRLSGCDRVYAIAFGEGAPHLHLHLIPRFADEPASNAWSVADLYRAVERGERAPADPLAVAALVAEGRKMLAANPLPGAAVRHHEGIG
jgi:diadenosine tetraphosphate (Ap4A) HIT family hydrolase